MEQEQTKGLYVPEMEHDACGIGFVAHLKGKKSHEVVSNAITMLENMQHRGASGAEKNTGDGAGILIQNPHDFFVDVCHKLGTNLPSFGKYGVGFVFFPREYAVRQKSREYLNKLVAKFGFELLCYREVPTYNKDLGASALRTEPHMEQIFVKPKYENHEPDEMERRLFVLRKYAIPTIKREVPGAWQFYMPSFSYKTMVYKGQLNATQIRGYFPDLEDIRLTSALALIHSRFSTNTFPEWRLAQPFRFLAHNGEINTLRGNLNWMKSFQTLFRSSYFTKEELELIVPLLDETESDSASLDKVMELLLLGGRSLAHVMMMLVPEAWENDDQMPQFKKDFYKFHGSLIQNWDGPASLCFTDGKSVGACLDRNGLRPSRYSITDDDMLVMSSETGSLPIDPAKVVKRGRLEPGKIFIADLQEGRIIEDEELKDKICKQQPYGEWLKKNATHIDELPVPSTKVEPVSDELLVRLQHAFGFTEEDFKLIIAPMFKEGKEPIGSMGNDVPVTVLSDQSQHLSNYFKQLFAQVSNPPMDSTREEVVMSLYTSVGKTLDILAEKPEHSRMISFDQPVLTNEQLEKVRNVSHPLYKCETIESTFEADGHPGRLEAALDRMCREAEEAIRFGCYNVLLITDKCMNENQAPIPSLLAVGAIHHHLLATGLRARVGLVIEAGDVRETHHFATIIGYGGNAINPYMVFESIGTMKEKKLLPDNLSIDKAIDNYIHGIGHGLLKIFAKMGISTLRSYHGAQIFEIIGLGRKVVDRCFNSTVSRIGGLDFDGIATEVLMRHKIAYPKNGNVVKKLMEGGIYQWKRRGEFHMFNPDSVYLLQYAVKSGNYQIYKQYAKLFNDQNRPATLRSLFKFKERKPILIEEVESKEKIFKRFATGAMSFGSISYEAHTTLAIAMNKIGGKSNSGEGGEDPIRYSPDANGNNLSSAIKQVASGRFGVNIYYLNNAKEIQIKIAQGAKPGEGGQLPGHKVDEWIGRVRNSTPGVGLISPPPHHDIYSIEDLAQLIFDLKNANRDARISVKLVSEAGVGTIAAGVAKAHADVILISGGDGGTGASPWSSIRHAGIPWEMGLSEAHQTLVRNNLRSRVTLQADGQLRTGRDIAIAALLGAEEWGISTGALVAMGCIMMRKCHLNTCPVGIATQNPILRERFAAKPEHVINFFTFIAEELREIMAELGFHTVDEMIGQANDSLEVNPNVTNWKAKTLDLQPILFKEPAGPEVGLYKQLEQDHELEEVLDWKLLEVAKPALEFKTKVKGSFDIINVNRAVGTILSSEVAKKYKEEGLPEDTIHLKFKGSAGQSFSAFGAHGLTMEVEGETNDYIGKGLSGAKIIVYPHKESKYDPHTNVIIGNVAFYGAIKGEAYIYGKAGQRFCVRNSGVKVVVEGVGDHGCEYMTGGLAFILGPTGRNFAAGMSGGIAYVYDPDKKLKDNINMEMVEFDAMDDEDINNLKTYIGNHQKYTGSKTAETIMKNFDKELANFIKVMPTDYKAVMTKRKQQAVTTGTKK